MNYQIMIDLCMLLLPIVIVVRLGQKDKMRGISKTEALTILLTTLMMVVAITLTMWVGQLAGVTNINDYTEQMSGTLDSATTYPSMLRFIFVTIVLVPIVEEFIFRYLVFKVLDKIKNIPYKEVFNIICSSVLFGCLHEIDVQKIYGCMCGLVLGLLYYYAPRLRTWNEAKNGTHREPVKDENLTRPILFHMTFNAIGCLSYVVSQIL